MRKTEQNFANLPEKTKKLRREHGKNVLNSVESVQVPSFFLSPKTQ